VAGALLSPWETAATPSFLRASFASTYHADDLLNKQPSARLVSGITTR
jgi:hypothetical protein